MASFSALAAARCECTDVPMCHDDGDGVAATHEFIFRNAVFDRRQFSVWRAITLGTSILCSVVIARAYIYLIKCVAQATSILNCRLHAFPMNINGEPKLLGCRAEISSLLICGVNIFGGLLIICIFSDDERAKESITQCGRECGQSSSRFRLAISDLATRFV